jgi:TetR/AcrR family transcriptional repressor of nem operon
MARPRKLDDDEALDRAMHAFWLRGWTATSIRDLEDRLGVKAPSIYRRFGSKDGLARAALDRYLREVIGRRIDRHLGVEGDPVANVRGFLASAVTPGPAGQPLLGCLLTMTAVELPALTPELGPLVEEGLASIEGALRQELERADRAGRLAAGVEPATAAASLTLGFQGLMVLARSGLRPALLLTRVDALLETVVGRPLGRPGPRGARR